MPPRRPARAARTRRREEDRQRGANAHSRHDDDAGEDDADRHLPDELHRRGSVQLLVFLNLSGFLSAASSSSHRLGEIERAQRITGASRFLRNSGENPARRLSNTAHGRSPDMAKTWIFAILAVRRTRPRVQRPAREGRRRPRCSPPSTDSVDPYLQETLSNARTRSSRDVARSRRLDGRDRQELRHQPRARTDPIDLLDVPRPAGVPRRRPGPLTSITPPVQQSRRRRFRFLHNLFRSRSCRDGARVIAPPDQLNDRQLLIQHQPGAGVATTGVSRISTDDTDTRT